MKICFNCKTKEWENICDSISLYLQYCHPIAKDDIRKTWKDDSKNGNPSCDCTESIIVVPLFEKVDGKITHHGLEVIRSLREKIDYGFNTIFMVLSKQDIPDYVHPENKMHYYAEGLLGNPKFDNVDQAVFLGEIIYKKKGAQNEKESSEDIEYTNIINLQEHDELKRLAGLIKGEKLPSVNEELRRKYYDIFVEYYERVDKYAVKVLGDTDDKKKEKREMLKTAQDIYNKLNDISGAGDHSEPYELFHAPAPFPLQELIDFKNEVKVEKLNLLLIDNRSDNKFVKNDLEPQSLCKIIEDFKLDDLFELKMLGNVVYKKEQGGVGFHINEEKLDKYSSIQRKFDRLTGKEFSEFRKLEEFDFRKFKYKESLSELEKQYHEDFIKECEGKKEKIETYTEFVYYKIKHSHLVLLDFFLNTENTYLAFDFIRDIADIKKQEGDVSTTWYFITSAVYDSVVKYSQSGLLAEYYESAVVSAGDDPTNKKRQIIFLYKLLTFINARFTNFERYKDSIHKKLFAEWENDVAINESQPYCKEYKEKESPPCDEEDCLKGLQNDIKRYLTEYDDVCSIFYDKKDNNDLKDIIESLDNVIKQFIWLPEADWYMIQHQIEFINNKLGRLQDKSLKKCKFSCRYILKELEDRSEVY